MATAAPAQAGLLVQSAGDCAERDISRPFTPWLDYANYEPTDDSGFENGGEGWKLGSSRVVSGNESFDVGGADDSKSLAIPARTSVTSPVMCVGILHPTMRFFAKSSGGLLSLSALEVEVLFEDAGGNVRSLPIGAALPTRSWQPSLPLPVLASLLPLLPGQQTPVAFRFTARGSASWQIDDVYVDPYRHK